MLRYIASGFVCLAIAGCNGMGFKNGGNQGSGNIPLPDKAVVNELPIFTQHENEVEIADSMNDVDPTWILGAIVNTQSGGVRGLDSFLAQNAKPTVTPQTEVVFKDFVENSLTASAGWLDFLKAQVTDTVRAEVSVVKTLKVTIKSSEIDRSKLLNEGKGIPMTERKNYGVIIGYIDFVLSAGLFKNVGTEDSASGYGAKIGGKWYSKFENTAAQHRVIAIWAPLPFVLENVNKAASAPVDLEKATREALRHGTFQIKALERAVIRNK